MFKYFLIALQLSIVFSCAKLPNSSVSSDFNPYEQNATFLKKKFGNPSQKYANKPEDNREAQIKNTFITAIDSEVLNPHKSITIEEGWKKVQGVNQRTINVDVRINANIDSPRNPGRAMVIFGYSLRHGTIAIPGKVSSPNQAVKIFFLGNKLSWDHFQRPCQTLWQWRTTEVPVYLFGVEFPYEFDQRVAGLNLTIQGLKIQDSTGLFNYKPILEVNEGWFTTKDKPRTSYGCGDL